MSWDLHARCTHCGSELAEMNYTHNTNRMMREAGHGPEDFDGKTVTEALPMLKSVIAAFEDQPDKYRAMNPDNGWGSYDDLLGRLRELGDRLRTADGDTKISVSM